MPDKPMTWIDIENSLRNSPGETDSENLAYFKEKILTHLDKLQEEEDKKIIPFPQKQHKKNKK